MILHIWFPRFLNEAALESDKRRAAVSNRCNNLTDVIESFDDAVSSSLWGKQQFIYVQYPAL